MVHSFRRWLRACSPFRWLEDRLRRLEQRQEAMDERTAALERLAEELRELAAELRGEVAEWRGELERMNKESAVDAAAVKDAAGPGVDATPSAHCPCGHPRTPNARFCPECGRVFQGRPRPD